MFNQRIRNNGAVADPRAFATRSSVSFSAGTRWKCWPTGHFHEDAVKCVTSVGCLLCKTSTTCSANWLTQISDTIHTYFETIYLETLPTRQSSPFRRLSRTILSHQNDCGRLHDCVSACGPPCPPRCQNNARTTRRVAVARRRRRRQRSELSRLTFEEKIQWATSVARESRYPCPKCPAERSSFQV